MIADDRFRRCEAQRARGRCRTNQFVEKDWLGRLLCPEHREIAMKGVSDKYADLLWLLRVRVEEIDR